MSIHIETIPQNKQRYSTCGDCVFNELGDLNMKVSDMGNRNYEFLVAVHEFVEAWLCREHGVKEEDVTAFDTSEYGLSLEDPGSDCKAPYHVEHMFALQIEKLLAEKLGVNWEEYENKLAETCPT